MFEFISPEILNWVVIPLAICLARIIDVTIGTIRIIYVAKGLKYLAPLLGFFEVFIWLMAIAQVMKNLTHWINYIAYALGFALGNFIGIIIEAKISVGHSIVRIITRKDPSELQDHLRENRIKFTKVASEGQEGSSHILLIIIKRKNINIVLDAVRQFNPKAFFSVEDVRFISDSYYTEKGWKSPFTLFFSKRKHEISKLFNGHRKGK